jgi:hypothetical protein
VRGPARSRRELCGATVLKRGAAFELAGERSIENWPRSFAACAAAGDMERWKSADGSHVCRLRYGRPLTVLKPAPTAITLL